MENNDCSITDIEPNMRISELDVDRILKINNKQEHKIPGLVEFCIMHLNQTSMRVIR